MAKSPAPPKRDPASAAPAPPRFGISLLDQVIGQAQAQGLLRAAMQSGRIHHAWIFHGPAGVGKFSTAIAFAAAILDPTTAPDLGGNLAPDPGSQTQRLVRQGGHPDLHVITKELAGVSREAAVRDRKQLTIPKDVVDEFLLEPASRTRVLAGDSMVGKVFIIDEAEMMDWRTQNVLLKTLEEPPPGTVIIIVTAYEDRLLPTIRSRCQRVPFFPLNAKQMEKWIKSAGVEVPAAQHDWLLRFAAGSPGSALAALGNDLFSWHQTLSPMLQAVSRGRFVPDLGPTMARLADERAAEWVKKNRDASKDAANKAWARRVLAFVADHFRSLLHERAAKGGDDPAVARALHAIDQVSLAEGYLASNVNMSLLMGNLAAQLAAEPEPV